MSGFIPLDQAPEVLCFWPVSEWSLQGPVSEARSDSGGQTTRATGLFHLRRGRVSEKGSRTSRPPWYLPEKSGLSPCKFFPGLEAI